MALVLNGSGTITGLTSGGLPDGSITSDDLASSVTTGKILQVIQTHLTTTSSQSLTASTRANISGLNATITPSLTSSKVRVMVRWNGEPSDVNSNIINFGIKRNTTDIGNPASAGNRLIAIAVLAQGYWNSNADSTMDSAMYEYIDSPSSTSAITYYATVLSKNTLTLYNQRTVGDSNTTDFERLTSTITLEEIAG